MSWLYADHKTIVHTTGLSIELLQGSWETPFGINPREQSPLPATVVAQLIREGLGFAKENNYDGKQQPNPAAIEQCVSVYQRRFASA